MKHEHCMLRESVVTGLPLITVVDDDASLRSALESLIRSLGYNVRTFASAEEAFTSGTALSSDCVITDIQMPGLSGLDFEAKLRATGASPPVILITARAEPELLAAAQASGAICVLRKPFDASSLIGCIEKALA